MRKPVFPNTAVLFAASNALVARVPDARTATRKAALALPDEPARPEPVE